jgi:hypothetical protein
MSAYLSPDVVVAIGRQRQHVAQVQASRWHLAKLTESGQGEKAGRHWIEMKSALKTRAGAVLLTWPRRAAGCSGPIVVGPRASRYQA